MVDYRQESIENARGAIKTVTLLNGGAAVALLTQLSTIPAPVAGAVLTSMIWWSVGLALAACAWVAAFLSTRYVDKWMDEKNDQHRITSNTAQITGIVMILLSIVTFLVGSLFLAAGFHGAYS
ncbi:hypothetical protein [Devosia sp. LC5]|uniref:hypothetical protein n=1 Tax=Devosia sp. LC5 TaxID=1502724 RepID=UPI00055194B8|nr:hypothetical protein [Devosia sp. LC5]